MTRTVMSISSNDAQINHARGPICICARPHVPEMMGRQGRVENIRELVVKGYPYMVAYRITEETIDLLAVRHSARLWPENLDSDG